MDNGSELRSRTGTIRPASEIFIGWIVAMGVAAATVLGIVALAKAVF